jgi:hypothetical protein
MSVTIGPDYMLRKPSGPSAPKLFFDAKVVPMAVNVAGAMEVVLDRASVRTGVRPALLLTGLLGLASAGLLLLPWRKMVHRASYRERV